MIENAGLTEWPVPLLGRFDPAFLDLPPEVIQLTVRANQKYFACREPSGQLAPRLRLHRQPRGRRRRRGDRRRQPQVLAARLSDARFFWEQDRKPARGARDEARAITFHEKLGTVADKVERVAKLAAGWSSEGDPSGDADPDLAGEARRRAALAKADLVTEMVDEFPELQGMMGGYLRRARRGARPSPPRSAATTSRSARATTSRPRRSRSR